MSKASKARRAADQAAQAQSATLPIVDAQAADVQVLAATVQGATAETLAQAAQGGTATDKACADARELLRKAAQQNRKAETDNAAKKFIVACKNNKRAMVCALYSVNVDIVASKALLYACGELYKNGKMNGDEYAAIKNESKADGTMAGYWRYAKKGLWKGEVTAEMKQTAGGLLAEMNISKE